MGAVCGKMKECCCCVPCKYQKSSTPSNLRFKNGRTKIMDSWNRERFGIPEGSYNVKLPGEKNCIINSSAFLPTGDIVLADMINFKLKLFNCNFQFISALEFPSPVQHISASPNLPLLYATFPDRIRQIHIDGISMKRSGFVKTPGTLCRGICVNRYDGKAVSLSITDELGQVNLMTPGGNLQLEVKEDDHGNPLFVKPDALAVSRHLDVAIGDKGAKAVIGITSEGVLKFIYKGVRFPTAVVYDEQDYIYVAGQNCVHQLNEYGELVKLFLSKAEMGLSPMSMCYNPNRRLLLVTGKGAKVSLFKLTS